MSRLPGSLTPKPRPRRARSHPVLAAVVLALAAANGAGLAPANARATRRHIRGAGPPMPKAADPLAGLPIKKVEIVGNTRTDKSVIMNQIRVMAGQPYHLSQVRVDVRSIASLGRFITVRADVIPTKHHRVIVRYVVRERPLIRAIEIAGNRHFNDTELRELIIAHVGGAIDPFVLQTDARAIARMYRRAGFTYAKVTVDKRLLKKGIVRYVVVQGPMVWVRHIHFIGDHNIAKWYLGFKIDTKTHFWFIRKGALDKNQVRGDTERIRKVYQGRGYLDARVSYYLHFSRSMRNVTVDFVINEGPRYRLGSIKLTGNHALTTARLLKYITIKPGDYWNRSLVKEIKEHMAKAYGHLGFIYSHIIPKFAYASQPGVVNLTFNITEGRPYTTGRVIIRGNPQLQDHVIRREIRIYPGSLYDTVKVERSEERLKDLQLFGEETITPTGHQPASRDALVNVTEQQSARFMVGAGVSTDAGLIGQISVQQKNFDITGFPHSLGEFLRGQAFKGNGQNFQVMLEPGTLYQQYNVTFSEPYLWDSPYSFTNDGYYFNVARESWTESRLGDRATFGRRFGDQWIVTLGLRAEDVNISGLELPGTAQIIQQNAGSHFLTSLEPAVVWDTTDSSIFPTRGFRASLAVEQYGVMGGAYHFTKVNATFDLYHTVFSDPFGRKTVIAWKNQLGFIPLGNPVFFEEFYGGGIGSLRGFKYRGVSPRQGPLNDPIGGKFLAITTGEYNFPIYQNMLRGVFFVDAGTVENNVRAGTIRVDAGFGIRLTIPFFGSLPLALDFAYPLNQAHGDNIQYVSFALGMPF